MRGRWGAAHQHLDLCPPARRRCRRRRRRRWAEDLLPSGGQAVGARRDKVERQRARRSLDGPDHAVAAHAGDRGVVDCDDDRPLLDGGARGRSVGVDLADDDAPPRV
eukprot:7385049-Prymnesium_polylepis.1